MTHEEKIELIQMGNALANLAAAFSHMSRADGIHEGLARKADIAAVKAVRCLDEAQVYSVEALKP